jgi:hypothetical protein
LNHPLTIRSWCTIRDRAVFRDGVVVCAAESASSAEFLLDAYQCLGADYPKFYKMDQLSKLGWLATEFLLQDQGLEAIAAEAVAMVVCNANSSLDTDLKYLESTRAIASPALFVYTLPNILLGEVAIRRGFKGENACFVLPEFDPVFLGDYVSAVFASGGTQVCICGWVDCLEERLDAALFLVGMEPGAKPFDAQTLRSVYEKS